jgi:hypothetical protein
MVAVNESLPEGRAFEAAMGRCDGRFHFNMEHCPQSALL